MQSRRGEERSEARQREGWPAPIREYSREPVLSKYTRRTNGEYTNRARACAGSGGRCGAFIVRPNEWMHTRYPGKLKHHLSNYNRRAIGLSFELFRIVPRSTDSKSARRRGGGRLCTDFPRFRCTGTKVYTERPWCGWIRNAGIDFCYSPPPRVSVLRCLWARMERW